MLRFLNFLKIFILFFLLLSSQTSKADWMDTFFEVTNRLAEKLLPDAQQKSQLAINERLKQYPENFKLLRATEPLFNSELFFLESGKKHKPPILLIHGLGELATLDWLTVIPALEDDYHVFAIDLPGFGLSQGKYFEYSPKNYSEIIHWFIKNVIPQTHHKPILVGHSMGAAVSLNFASQYPRNIEKLILVSAAGILERTSYIKHLSELKLGNTNQNKVWQGLTRRLNHFSSKWVERTGEAYDPTDIIKQNSFLRKLLLKDRNNLNAGLALIDTNYSLLDFDHLPPTGLIWGSDDPIAPIRTGKILAEKIPNSILISMDNAGHVPMKAKTAEFNFLLRNLLEKKRQFKNKRQLPLLSTTTSKKVGHCKDDDKTHFTGHYRLIFLDNCKKVTLKNVVSETLFANHSIVNIENSTIGKIDQVTKIYFSRLKVTASRVLGSIHSKESRLDFAGVEFESKDSSISSLEDSLFILSLCTIRNPYFQGPAHGYYKLAQEAIESYL